MLAEAQRIAYLGPGGSYTEMAKDKFCEKYNIGAYQEPLKTIRQVVEYVDENPNILGVLPVENSIEGSVRETIDNLIAAKNNVKILSEVILPIKHCLLSRNTEIYNICGVISHPQAIAQCQTFIHNELPWNLDIIEASSTAEAANKLSGYNLTYSAIGSEKTAQIYNLNILKDNINDDPTNHTRFALIGKYDMPVVENSKTTLTFSTENKPGALLDILKVFMTYNINLSYIDSRPSRDNSGGYTFIVDFDGHINNPMIKQVVDSVSAMAKKSKFLGSFEKGEAYNFDRRDNE